MYQFLAPCHFGLEAVLKREVEGLGLSITNVEDGRVRFAGDASAIARANIGLRTAERVLLELGRFPAESFDELFEATKALPWEELIPKDGRVWVAKASSVKSKLFSPTDIQKIVKKAIADRLCSHYHLSWLPEDGAAYPLRVTIRKDEVSIGLDTTGTSLHKRGYRKESVLAPISETLAAALLLTTPFRKGRILVDPFCGSGTFPIEAAMIARNIAPGWQRDFLAESWESIVTKEMFDEERTRAKDLMLPDGESDLQGYDIDAHAVRAARANAQAAGVADAIHFQQRDVKDLSHPKPYGFLIMNPPYGERLTDDLKTLYRAIGEAYARLDNWSMYVLTSFDDVQKLIGRKADKNRKIYNGMIRTYFYSYLGKKPQKKG